MEGILLLYLRFLNPFSRFLDSFARKTLPKHIGPGLPDGLFSNQKSQFG
jgi:hypothetical protein